MSEAAPKMRIPLHLQRGVANDHSTFVILLLGTAFTNGSRPV